jgi:hypothetical protein
LRGKVLAHMAATEAAAGAVTVAQLRVLSRAATPVSNVCSLQVDVLPGVDVLAFATADGCILLQQVTGLPAMEHLSCG